MFDAHTGSPLRKSLRSLAVLALGGIVLTGCSSTQMVATRAPNPAVSSRGADLADAAEAAFRQDLDSVARQDQNAFLSSEWVSTFPGHTVSVTQEVQRVGADLVGTLDYELETLYGFFDMGKYRVEELGEGDAGTTTFLRRLMRSLSVITEKMEGKGDLVSVDATFYGRADCTPVRSRGILYGGEYRQINMPSWNTLVNGVPGSITIDPGDRMTNIELAAARAYSAYYHAREIAVGPARNFHEHFDVAETNLCGPKHRSVKVTFQIRRVGVLGPMS